MSFASDLSEWVDEQLELEDYDSIEYLWRDLASKKTASVKGHTLKLVKVWNGPESGKYDWQFAFTVDEDLYLAIVDYDSYEYSGHDYTLYHSEPYEFTETRYKTSSVAR